MDKKEFEMLRELEELKHNHRIEEIKFETESRKSAGCQFGPVHCP